MSKLVPPHGSDVLKPLLLSGKALEDEKKKAEGLKRVPMTSRETSDLIMLGIGAFTPLDGFMGKEDLGGGLSQDSTISGFAGRAKNMAIEAQKVSRPVTSALMMSLPARAVTRALWAPLTAGPWSATVLITVSRKSVAHFG